MTGWVRSTIFSSHSGQTSLASFLKPVTNSGVEPQLLLLLVAELGEGVAVEKENRGVQPLLDLVLQVDHLPVDLLFELLSDIFRNIRNIHDVVIPVGVRVELVVKNRGLALG